MAVAKKAAKAAANAGTKTEEEPAPAVIQIRRIGTELIEVPIIGTAPIVVHRFSEKAKRIMLEAMQGKKKVREFKDPEAEFNAAFYRFNDGRLGFPSLGFKDATVSGARYYAGITMVLLRQLLFIQAEHGVDGVGLVQIDGDPAIMREDVVRVGQSGTDLRYRPQINNWTATLRVRYVTSQLSRESVLSLIDAGGMGVGVGEWRPERKGEMGTYTIDENRQVLVIEENVKKK